MKVKRLSQYQRILAHLFSVKAELARKYGHDNCMFCDATDSARLNDIGNRLAAAAQALGLTKRQEHKIAGDVRTRLIRRQKQAVPKFTPCLPA